jgi:hypothetical protein
MRAAKAIERRLRREQRYHDDGLDTVDRLAHGAQALEAVAALAVVEVAIRREQHLRRDLAEAVEDAVDAEIRRARRPDRADARCGQHGHQGLGEVRHEAGHPVAGPHTGIAQGRGEARYLVEQLAVRKRAAAAVLEQADHRGAVIVPSQQILGVVELRTGEPARTGEPLAILEYHRAALTRAHPGEVPQQGPEGFRRLDRPAVQRRVAGAGSRPTDRLGSFHERGDRLRGNACRRR